MLGHPHERVPEHRTDAGGSSATTYLFTSDSYSLVAFLRSFCALAIPV